MHLDPSDENARLFFARGIEGPLTMLNLLRFRDWAGVGHRTAALVDSRLIPLVDRPLP